MPLLVLHPRDACVICGCRVQGILVATFRINKTTLKSHDRGALRADLGCPECGPKLPQPLPDKYAPDAKSDAIVQAHRAKKGWS